MKARIIRGVLRLLIIFSLLFFTHVGVGEEPEDLQVQEHPPVPWKGSSRRRHSDNAWKGAATLYGGLTESPQFTSDVRPVTLGAQFDARVWADLSAGAYFLTFWNASSKTYNFGLALQLWRLFRSPLYVGLRLGAMLLDGGVLTGTVFSGGGALGLDIPIGRYFSFGIEFAAFQTAASTAGSAPLSVTLPSSTLYHGFVAVRYNYREY